MNREQLLRSVFSVPGAWADEASRRKAEVLYITQLFIFIGGLFYLFIPSWLLNGEPVYVAGTISISGVGWLLLKSGRLKASAIWTIGVLWILFAAGSSTEGGITSGSFAGTLAFVMLAGLTYGIGASVLVAIASITAGAVLIFLKHHSLLPVQTLQYSELNILADFAVYTTLTCVFTAVAVRRINRSTENFESELKERRRREEESRIYEHTLQSIAEIATITDLDDHLTFVNDAFLTIYGYTREDVIGRHISILWSPNNPPGLLQDILSRKKMGRWQGTILNLTKDGREFPISLTTSEVRDGSGRIIGLVGISDDITERQKIQQQLLQSQKLESLGTLTGGIAHDFNNLLAMILGSAELLQLQLTDQSGLRKHVDRIVEASERGRSISRQLLVFSRPDQAELQPVLLASIIAALADMLQHFLPKSIAVRTEVDERDSMVLGDAGQIHQALLNLALNAGDAMTNSGMLTIKQSIVAREMMEKRFDADGQGDYICVAVCDTGTGIEASVLAKIFDPFFSTKERGKGTGLGLAMVHGIVKNHNGYIDVDSTPGEGTEVRLYFPAAARSAADRPPALIPPAQKHSGTVLLVDDEKLLLDMLCEYLTATGYEVLTATNGAEGLALFSDKHESIDIVITDLGMPEMGGEELSARLRAIDPDVKVIVSSGYLDGTTKKELLASGICDVLTKPFNIHDIHASIRMALHSS